MADWWFMAEITKYKTKISKAKNMNYFLFFLRISEEEQNYYEL